MKQQSNPGRVMSAILITRLLAGCGTPAATSPPTAAPTPTSKALPYTVPDVIKVTFDGSECTVDGPAVLPMGRQSFFLIDLSEQNQELYVSRLLDGKTFQDLLDLQSEPGEYVPKPSWTAYAPKAKASWDDSIGALIYPFTLVEEGDYAIYIGSYSPESIWNCAPLQVIEAPSE